MDAVNQNMKREVLQFDTTFRTSVCMRCDSTFSPYTTSTFSVINLRRRYDNLKPYFTAHSQYRVQG